MIAAAMVKDRLRDPAEVAALLGLEIGKARQRNGLFARCVVHDDGRASLSITSGADGLLRCHCFACGWSGDVLALVAVSRGLDSRSQFPEVLRIAADMAGISHDEDRQRPRGRTVPPIDIALTIDRLADEWLAGRDIRATDAERAAINGATAEVIAEAFDDLRAADALIREDEESRDRALEGMTVPEWPM